MMNEQMRIFLFHGVVREHRHRLRNYTRKHLSVDEFVNFVRAAKKLYQPVTMDECLEACLGKSDLPPQPFTVTFDDGFENNALVAAPILVDLGLPATFYLTTGVRSSPTQPTGNNSYENDHLRQDSHISVFPTRSIHPISH